jgi:aspartyl-tRNA(Asn)/glutamyl-tRNA(Gln) amidotransferase subunit A
MTSTIKQLSILLAEGKASSVELSRDYLGRIQALNHTLNAFVTVDPDKTLAEARRRRRAPRHRPG